jgi:hypothetical protein
MNQGPRGDCLMKKNRLSKISWHCPFNLKLLVFSSIIVFKIGENSWTLMFIFFLETFYLCNWISPRYYRPMPIQTVYSVFNNRNSKDLKNFPIKQNFKILVGWGCESRKLLYHSIRNKFESNNYLSFHILSKLRNSYIKVQIVSFAQSFWKNKRSIWYFVKFHIEKFLGLRLWFGLQKTLQSNKITSESSW